MLTPLEALELTPELLAVLRQLRDLIPEAHALADLAVPLADRVREAIAKDGPGGRRITKREMRRVFRAAHDLADQALAIDPVRYADLGRAVLALAMHLLRDVAD